MTEPPETLHDKCPVCETALSGLGSKKYCRGCAATVPFLKGIGPTRDDFLIVRTQSEQGIAVGSRDAEQSFGKWLEFARATDQTELNFAGYLSNLLSAGTRLSLPSRVIVDAGRLTKEAFEKRLTKGKSTEVLVASLVYTAARRQECALTVDQLAVQLHLNKRDVERCFRQVSKILCERLPPPSAEGHLSKILQALSVGEDASLAAKAMLEAVAEANFINGRSPAAIAAAVTYLAGNAQGNRLTQREVAAASFVTETTIRKVCSEIASIIAMMANKTHAG